MSIPRGRATPAHQRVSDDLRRRIKASDFADGRRMPTEIELEREYGVSRQTVRRAFQDLVAEGLVHRVPGRGTFATQPGSSARYARSVGSLDDLMVWDESEMEVTEPMALRNDPAMASRLELESTVVAVVGLRRTVEGEPFATTEVFVSPHIGQRLVEDDVLHDGANTVIRAVDSYLPDTVAGVQQVITAVPASEGVARALGVEPGSAVLRVERVFFDTEDSPVEVSVTHHHPERYAYRLELRGKVAAAPPPEPVAVLGS